MAVGFPVFLMNHEGCVFGVSPKFSADVSCKVRELLICHRFRRIKRDMSQAVSNAFAFRFFHPILEQIVATLNETDGFVLGSRENMT